MSAIIEATLNQSYKIEVTLVGNINYLNSVVPAHTHNVADITNISSFYASISHTHTVSQITDIASNYAPLNHTHPTLYEPKNTNIQNHISSTDNPHGVSKSQVGLSNVTNNAQVKKRASSVIGNIPTWDVATGDSLGAGYGVDTTLTAGTDKIPTSSAVKTKTDSIDSNITTLTNSVNSNTSAINSLDSRLDTAESEIDTLQSNVSTNTTNISTNTTNIGTLQSDVTSLDGRLDTAESEIDTLQTNVSTNTTNISTNTTNISTLQSDVTTLDGRLDTAESEITSLTTNVSTNTTNIGTLQSDVTTLDGRLDTAESSITTLTTNISTNTTNIGTLQSDVTTLDGRLDTAESEIDTLQTNVSTLTTNVSTNTTNIGTLQSDVTALDGRLDTAESEIDTLQTNVSTLTTNVSTNTTNISTLQSDVTALDGRLDTAESNITSLTTNVSTNTTNIGTLQSDVTTLDGRLDTAESEIDTLQSQITTKQNTLVANDITTSLIANSAVTNDKLSTGIDATKIADGTISNTEFQYLNNVTSNIQTQLDAKQNTLVANDITTTLINNGAVTETKIADNAVTNSKLADNAVNTAEIADNAITTAKIANGNVTLAKLDSTGATSGQVPTYNGTNIAWSTPSGGGGGGGISDGDKGDITVSGSGSVLTIDNNAVSLAKMQQVGAYKTLANITGSTANLTEVNFGSVIQGAVTLSADVTYAKSDFAGRTHLLLSTNSTTMRTFTISNTGFVAGDAICLIAQTDNLAGITIFFINGYDTSGFGYGFGIGTLHSGKVEAIFNGTQWVVFSNGQAWLTSATTNNTGVVGNIGARATLDCVSVGFLATSTKGGGGLLPSEEGSMALGHRSTANMNGCNTLGASSTNNSFAFHNAIGNGVVGRRFGATRIKINQYLPAFDSSGWNPSSHKEWVSWNGTTTNATITEIFLRGVSSNRCVLQAKNVLKFRGQATAFRSDYSGTAGWDITGIIKRNNSNVTTLVGVTTTLTHSDGTGGTLVLTISADDTNEALRVQVTGNASETWTWLVELELLDLRIS